MEDNVSLGGERDPLLPRERQQIEQIDFRSGRETLQRSKCDAGYFQDLFLFCWPMGTSTVELHPSGFSRGNRPLSSCLRFLCCAWLSQL